MLSPSYFWLACLVGVGGHLAVFIRGEWERHAPRIARIVVLGEIGIFLVLWMSQQFVLGNALLDCLVLNLGFDIGLFGSIGIYRLLFHPLRAYPGPFGAKLTAFHSMKATIAGRQFHKKTYELHRKYGDFVRIRPREISINLADAVRDVHGPLSKCIKGPFYDLNYPSRSLQMTRDRSFHSKRKRVWEKGLSATAMSDYEPRIMEHCKELLSKLSERANTAVTIPPWLNFFGFDVMGDLAFGKSFNMLKQGKPHFMMTQLQEAGPIVAVLVIVPWLFILFQSIPLISAKRAENVAWCGKQVQERKLMSKSRVDLFTYLLLSSTDDPRNPTITDGDLICDSELAIVAGSDTTSATLATIVYLLAKNPDKQKRLQEEIDQLVKSPVELRYRDLVGKARVLDGYINEALRLYPAVPSGMQRMTPPEGALIAGKMIPGDTIVSTPTYTLHRDPRNFTDPDTFIPERWSSQAHLIKAKDAFNPFLIGPYSCVGKNLAMMEMRMLVACLTRSFSFRFPDNQEAAIVEDFEASYKDHFTARLANFDIVISRRN